MLHRRRYTLSDRSENERRTGSPGRGGGGETAHRWGSDRARFSRLFFAECQEALDDVRLAPALLRVGTQANDLRELPAGLLQVAGFQELFGQLPMRIGVVR